MELKPRHTKIIETHDTKFGILVREDYYQYPEEESNLYLIDGHGKVKWYAEVPVDKDAYPNPIRFLDEDHIQVASWNCYSCKISLIDGKIITRHFTK